MKNTAITRTTSEKNKYSKTPTQIISTLSTISLDTSRHRWKLATSYVGVDRVKEVTPPRRQKTSLKNFMTRIGNRCASSCWQKCRHEKNHIHNELKSIANIEGCKAIHSQMDNQPAAHKVSYDGGARLKQTRATSRSAVAELHINYSVLYRGNGFPSPSRFALRVLYRRRSSRNCMSRATLSIGEIRVNAQVY